MNPTATRPDQFDLVIFDCDGVLLDSEWIACAVDAELLTTHGFPITTDEVIRRFTGVPNHAMFAEIECQLGYPLPAELPVKISARLAERYRTDLKPITNVAETLAELSLPACVASSSMPAKLGLGLIQVGLFEHFYPHIFSTSLVANGKPAPDLFLFAADQMGKSPEGCAVVEDSVAGIRAARAAGMFAIGFTGGSHCPPDHASRLVAAGAQVVIERFSELPAVLNGGRRYGSQ